MCILNDVIMSSALVYEAPEDDIMRAPPRRRGVDRLFTWSMLFFAYGYLGIITTISAWIITWKYLDSVGLPWSDWFYSWTNLSYTQGGDPLSQGAGITLTPDDVFEHLNRLSSIFYIVLVTMQFGNIFSTRFRSQMVIPMPEAIFNWARVRQLHYRARIAAKRLSPWRVVKQPVPEPLAEHSRMSQQHAAGEVAMDPLGHADPAAGSIGTERAYDVAAAATSVLSTFPQMQHQFTIRANTGTLRNDKASMALSATAAAIAASDANRARQRTEPSVVYNLLFDNDGNLLQIVRILFAIVGSVLVAVVLTEGAAFHDLFYTYPVPLSYWFIGFACGCILFVLAELRKWIIFCFPGRFADMLQW